MLDTANTKVLSWLGRFRVGRPCLYRELHSRTTDGKPDGSFPGDDLSQDAAKKPRRAEPTVSPAVDQGSSTFLVKSQLGPYGVYIGEAEIRHMTE